jgi:hypothetical protein
VAHASHSCGRPWEETLESPRNGLSNAPRDRWRSRVSRIDRRSIARECRAWKSIALQEGPPGCFFHLQRDGGGWSSTGPAHIPPQANSNFWPGPSTSKIFWNRRCDHLP